ncbi:MAG: DNA adenine methylase, partial [Deltaproteobacteria bacterium]|nr:DNA adenine methylase [Deltaproteobacteria bacterium]
VQHGDFVYCDPPYVGRHVDYYDSWSGNDERELFDELSSCLSQFILSTWHSNRYRKNPFLQSLWSGFHILTKEHFYHVGAKETNRNPMLEALVMNFVPEHRYAEPIPRPEQLTLFEKVAEYQSLTNKGLLPSRGTRARN